MLNDLFAALIALLCVRGLTSLFTAVFLFFVRPKNGRPTLVFDLREAPDPETELRRLTCEARLLGVWGRLPVVVRNAPPTLKAAFSQEKHLIFSDKSHEQDFVDDKIKEVK